MEVLLGVVKAVLVGAFEGILDILDILAVSPIKGRHVKTVKREQHD